MNDPIAEKVLRDVAAEVQRQYEQEKIEQEKDAERKIIEMLEVVGFYAFFSNGSFTTKNEPILEQQPTEDKREFLVKEAALWVAKIEQLDREQLKDKFGGEEA